MAREGPGNRQMRARIAQHAARLMAEDGLDDFGAAKRKAARQLGVSETRNLPDNAEVEAALRVHQNLYQADEQPERLAWMRTTAAHMMALLNRFDPHLTGAVVAGTAGRYSRVELHLYTDNGKEVELFLLDRGLRYRTREAHFWAGDEQRLVPVFEIETEGAPVALFVFDARDRRVPVKATPEGRPVERSRCAWPETISGAGKSS